MGMGTSVVEIEVDRVQLTVLIERGGKPYQNNASDFAALGGLTNVQSEILLELAVFHATNDLGPVIIPVVKSPWLQVVPFLAVTKDWLVFEENNHVPELSAV
jgi:hypothetical protein